jgi:plastocyanin
MELKAAYNYEHMLFTVAAIYVTPAGTVGYVDADGTQHPLTTVIGGTWNDYALTIDVKSGKGTLYVNGDEAGTFDLPDTTASGAKMHGATVVQFNQAGATKQNGDCLYVDDFFANELTNVSRTLEDTSANQTTLGRFMAIVRKIIEIDGEQVELVEWGWIPGL